MGAQRIKTNFDELERSVTEASRESREKETREKVKEEQQTIDSRLAYQYEQDLTLQAKKVEERTKHMDPTKAGEAERLGMGFNARRYDRIVEIESKLILIFHFSFQRR